MTDPTKLLIPQKKKLWFKIDPKLPLFNKKNPSRDRQGATVTTTGKSGKTLASKSYELDFRDGPLINAALTTETDVTGALPLKCNIQPPLSFNGQMLGHKGFLLTQAQRDEILTKDKRSRAVIFPYLNGREVLSGNGRPDRFVLDFDQLNQIDAGEFRAAFEWVRKHVYPDRLRKAEEGKDGKGKMRPHHKAFISRWWQLSFGRPELLSILKPLPRYLVCSLVTKRPIFVFISSAIRPSNLLQVFALPDDYSFGILQSAAHWNWFKAKSSKLKSDYRFGENVWNTFPWPQSPTKKQIQVIANAGRNIRRVRDDFHAKNPGGLRALYRALEAAGEHPLKTAHAALDAAVLDAYGFDPKKDLLARLLELNLQVAANIEAGKPAIAPGIPPTYGDSAPLTTDDCIQP